jgi:CDP-paratose 2-epimerase
MDFKNLLITGGAGFVGSNLALLFREARPELAVTVLDSLKRRGSELNLPRLREGGVEFRHGDIRSTDDFDDLPPYDLMIDCSAEPSVQAGLGGSPRAVLDTNLVGTINCLEAARARGAAFLFLSTSRIYPIQTLNDLPFTETDSRFRWDNVARIPGFSGRGIAEGFSLDGARSFYGTSKLAGEQLIQEYVFSYGMRALIDRCGVIAGPWQMGKVDQGVITLWVARHYFGRPLRYTGFGGHGKQVRDILHVHDLFDLLQLQLETPERWDGRVYNIGGGNDGSVSLAELTGLCVQETGNTVPITSVPETAGVDLRVYVTDAHKAEVDFGWRPTRNPARIVRDIRTWIEENRESLENILA